MLWLLTRIKLNRFQDEAWSGAMPVARLCRLVNSRSLIECLYRLLFNSYVVFVSNAHWVYGIKSN